MGQRVRQVETSYHGPGIHVCGIQPTTSEERVATNRDYHPGFGYLALRRYPRTGGRGRRVWSTALPEESKTLSRLEREFITSEDDGIWRLDVDGAMVSYTLRRRGPKHWVLESSRQGFGSCCVNVTAK